MNDPFIILCIAAVYFFVGLVMQFVVFDKYERGEEDITDSEIVNRQLAIWLWPLILILNILITILVFIFWYTVIPIYSIWEKFSKKKDC